MERETLAELLERRKADKKQIAELNGRLYQELQRNAAIQDKIDRSMAWDLKHKVKKNQDAYGEDIETKLTHRKATQAHCQPNRMGTADPVAKYDKSRVVEATQTELFEKLAKKDSEIAIKIKKIKEPERQELSIQLLSSSNSIEIKMYDAVVNDEEGSLVTVPRKSQCRTCSGNEMSKNWDRKSYKKGRRSVFPPFGYCCS